MNSNSPDHGDRAYSTEAERAELARRTAAAHERLTAAFDAPAAGRRPQPLRLDPADAEPGMQRMAAAYDAATPTD